MNRRWLLRTMVCAGPALLSMPVAAEWRYENKDLCERVDDKLKDIESRRRAGYTPKQGRSLAAQREKLEQQRREKCR